MSLQAWPRIDDTFSSLDDFVVQCFRHAASTDTDLRALIRQPERAYLGCGLPPMQRSKTSSSKTFSFRLTARPRDAGVIRVTAVNLEHDCNPAKRFEQRNSGEARAKMLNRIEKLEQDMKDSVALPRGRRCRSPEEGPRDQDGTAELDERWPPKRFSSLHGFQSESESYAKHHNFWLFGRRIPKTGEYRYLCSHGRDRPGPPRADACPFMLCALETSSGRAKLSKFYLEHNHELAPPSEAHSPKVGSRLYAQPLSIALCSRSTTELSGRDAVVHSTDTPSYSKIRAGSVERLPKRIRLAAAFSSSSEGQGSRTNTLTVCAALLPRAMPLQLNQLANDLRALGVETADDLSLLRLLDPAHFAAFTKQHIRYVHKSPALDELFGAMSASTLHAQDARASWHDVP